MNRIILASHGGFSAGALDTVTMILGQQPGLYAVSTTREEKESITLPVERLLKSFPNSDPVYILTDVLGGSVNNDMLSLLPRFPHVTILCGMNIPLILALAALDTPPTKEELADMIKQAQTGILNCSALLKGDAKGEEEEDVL